MKKISLILGGILCTLTACDLKPKIMSLPDSVGEFISDRYPALLADPNVYPEIYNSAVTDYGVYASPELYGTDTSNDYVVYASVDDYIVPPQDNLIITTNEVESSVDAKTKDLNESTDAEDNDDVETDEQVIQTQPSTDFLLVPMYGGPQTEVKTTEVIVQPGDTLYKLAQQHRTSVEDLAALNKLQVPYVLKVGQKLQVAGQVKVAESDKDVLKIAKPVSGVQTATRVELVDVVVKPGDTLYSLSRKYSVPVNDLAVMNNLSVPFSLSVGQKIRVPNLAQAPVAKIEVSEKVAASSKAEQIKTTQKISEKSQNSSVKVVKVEKTEPVKTVEAVKETKVVKTTTEQKISSDPTKKLPKITARSSSKFSWPVRGKILSGYGAKSNGLFNDGINISAKLGTAVKAAENGVVAYAGNEVKGMGNLIIIQHDAGWMTVYAHMDTMTVRRGAKVSVGQKIGAIGKTGKVDSPQLHFEIRKGTKAYNPTEYLKK